MRSITTFAGACLLWAGSIHAAIAGFVSTPGGAPVAGARIEIQRAETVVTRRSAALGLTPASKLIATAQSADDGSFTSDFAQSGLVMVTVRAAGFAPARVLATADDDAISFKLAEAKDQPGRVTASGKPLAGAIVIAEGNEGLTLSTITAADGTFRLPRPTAWATQIIVAHPAYALATRKPDANLDFDLAPGGTLPQEVKLSDGSVAKNFTLFLNDIPLARTTAAGQKVAALPAARMPMRILTDTESGVAKPGTASTSTAPSQTIEGVVRDARGRVIPGVPVTAFGARTTDASMAASDISDTSGHYRIVVDKPGPYWLFVPQSLPWAFQQASVTVSRGANAKADVTSTGETKFATGVVHTADGAPIAGAAVSLSPASPTLVLYASRTDRGGAALTNRAGRFRLALPDIPADVRLTAAHADFAATSSPTFHANQPPARTELTLRPGVALKGRVARKDGTAVAGADVVALERTTGSQPYPLGAALGGGNMKGWTTTDADGAFVIHVNDARHDVAAWKDGFAPADVREAAADAPVAITLDAGYTISGKVVSKGKPPAKPGVIVAVSRTANFMTRATVDPDGRFTLKGLPKATYQLMYGFDEQPTAQVMAEAPASDVVIELPATGELTGQVVDAAGKPVSHYSISSGSETDPFTEPVEVDDEAGRFTLPSVSHGEVTLRVTAEGFAEGVQKVLVGDDTAAVKVILAAGRTIRGRVVDENGAGVANVNIMTDGDFPDPALSDETGAFALDHAPVNAIRIDASADGYVAAEANVAAGTGDATVTLTLERGHSVKGRVVDDSGQPVEGADVNAQRTTGGASGHASSAADGSFEIGALAAGKYEIEARKGGARATAAADTETGKPVIITLALGATGSIKGSVTAPKANEWQHLIVTGMSGDDFIHGSVEPDGTFRIENVAAGEVTLHAMAMTASGERSGPSKTIPIVAGQTSEVQLSIGGGVTVTGRIVADGKPAAGASVTFASRLSESSRWRVLADGRGEYTIEGVTPGDYTVYAQALSLSKDVEAHVDAASQRVDITMNELVVTGRVIDVKGVGISDAAVTMLRGIGQHASGETKTTATGDFVFRTTATPPVEIAIAKGGYATARRMIDGTSSTPLLVTLGETAGARVRLVDAARGTTLHGYTAVRDQDGIEVPPAQQEQPDGSVLLSLPAGQYRVSASSDGYASRTVRVTIPAPGEIAIPLSPGGTLVLVSDVELTDLVKLISAGGEEYVRCYCNGLSEIRLTGKSTKVEHVAAGDYVLAILDATGRAKTQQPVTIVENQTTRVELRLR